MAIKQEDCIVIKSAKGKKNSTNIYSHNCSGELSKFLDRKNYSQHFILVDDNTVNLCLPVLLKGIQELQDATVIEIFSGEAFKNIDTVQQVWEQLTEYHADRRSVLINLVGGMGCDLGGFAAATYKRGIDFIHLPTTLLSQADAAYGGKQGIDFSNYKNQIGVFKDPAAIFVNPEFLKTLPAEQILNGFAEVVKHSLLDGGKFWKKIYLIENLSSVNWKKIVQQSCEFKLSVVKADPYEKGLRKILNFGHTIGHAIETHLLKNNVDVLHGYCVAAGMIGELHLSHKLCGMPEKKMRKGASYITNHFPNVNVTENFFAELLTLMKQDKKNRDGQIQFALLKDIGMPMINVAADEETILKALHFIEECYNVEKSL
ncbi:MAG: 3-dehydroquinate synthase [Chitinophagales bacterium]|nr:3-dehydroquinate synthase [Chitinophagales bacterium]